MVSWDIHKLFKRVSAIFTAGVIGLTCGIPAAHAEEQYPDVMLGVFTNSEADGTDTFYMSYDGYHFEKISQAFENINKNDPARLEAVGSKTNGRNYNLYSFKCPSIIYYNGYFWMLSNESNGGDPKTDKNAGNLRLVISNSKDLVHWSDQRQVLVSVPTGIPSNDEATKFDAVAADWAVDPSTNTPYAVVSIGRYGAFHGQAEKDTMRPYLVKFSQLSATNDPARDPKQNWEGFITAKTEMARPINLPKDSNNRIDGSLFFENGKTYLSIKEDGIYNEIWRIDSLNDCGNARAWKLLNGDVHRGYEAPSLTKLNGKYYFFTDEISTWKPSAGRTGTYTQSSADLTSWTNAQGILAYNSNGTVLSRHANNDWLKDGPRHGTVITVTDPSAKKVIWQQRKTAGWTSDLPAASTFSDVYNASSVLKNDQGTPHASDIQWLSDAEISTGWRESNGLYTFRGMDTVKRQDMAAFLRREAVRRGIGDASSWKPAVADWDVFSDVGRDTPHAEDVLWLAHAGVSTGWREADGSRTFRGMDTVKRQDMAAFLRRLTSKNPNGVGAVVPKTDFTDVTDATPHAEDVRWLGGSGISQGYRNPDGGWRFEGMTSVYRQDMAAFLHRLDGRLV